jgi:hypothetical protein
MKNNKICTVTTLKAPLEQTLSFVNYHLNIGIDHMFLFFDNPKDRAIEILKDYDKVTCFRCDKKHWKKRGIDPNSPFQKRLELNASFIFNQLKKEDYDWMFAHLDSDELIYLEKDIKKFLSKISKKTDVICLTTLEAIPEKEHSKDIFKEINLFKSIGCASRFYYKHKKLLQKVIPLIKKQEGNISGVYFRGHAAGKSIIKVGTQIERFQGHRPIAKKEKKLIFEFPKKANILHFDNCTFKDWKQKYLNRYKSGISIDKWQMSKKRLELYKGFVEVYKKDDENQLKKLYKKQYFIRSPLKEILRLGSFIKKIKLSQKLFEKPEAYIKPK